MQIGSLKSRAGFTLVELILVIAILAILASLVLPKLDGLQSNAGHAAGASSAADLYGYLEVYKMTKHAYPDGWDTLMQDSSDLWVASVPGVTPTLGLVGELVPATTPMLVATPLEQNDINALTAAGINTLFNLTGSLNTPGTKTRPADMFTTPVALSTGQSVAVLSPAGSKGAKIIDHIYTANSLVGGTSGALPSTVSKLIVFGFGSHNAMVGGMLAECPTYANVDPSITYNRLLVVFEITTSGKATVKAVLGADGDLISDMIANASKTPS